VSVDRLPEKVQKLVLIEAIRTQIQCEPLASSEAGALLLDMSGALEKYLILDLHWIFEMNAHILSMPLHFDTEFYGS